MTMQNSKTQRGLSLIELLVALGLGAFLILGVVNVFLSNKESSQVEQSLARLQENGRIALDLITADLRDSGYIGCNSAQGTLTVMANSAFFDGMEGYERTALTWNPLLPARLNGISGTGVATGRVGSDVIKIQHSRNIGSELAAVVTTASTSVAVDDNPQCINQGEFIVIGSCSTAHLFQVTNTPDCDGTPTTFQFAAASNTPASMIPGYALEDELMQFFETAWYVGDTGRTRAGNVPVFALYRRVNGANAEEMVEGVEYMQIQYGQLLESGNIRYVSANDLGLDYTEVVSVRIAMLMQSFELILDAPDDAAYQLLDQSIDSAGTTFLHNGDRTLRRVFQTTVLLRNLQNAS